MHLHARFIVPTRARNRYMTNVMDARIPRSQAHFLSMIDSSSSTCSLIFANPSAPCLKIDFCQLRLLLSAFKDREASNSALKCAEWALHAFNTASNWQKSIRGSKTIRRRRIPKPFRPGWEGDCEAASVNDAAKGVSTKGASDFGEGRLGKGRSGLRQGRFDKRGTLGLQQEAFR